MLWIYDACQKDVMVNVQANAKNDIAGTIALEPAIRFNGGGEPGAV